MKKRLSSQQQMQIIEGLCLAFENGRKTKEDSQKIMDSIYKISHINGSCKNVHQDWHDEGFKLIEEFNKSGLIEIDKEEWRK